MTEPPVLEHAHGATKPGLSALTKKIGPLPGIVWVLIVVAGYVLYRRYKGGTATAVDPNAGVATDALSTDPSASLGGATYSGGGGATPSGSSTTSQSNGQWASAAANALIASGSDPSLVSNALSNYLNGLPLSSDQNTIVQTAVREFGVPPEGVLPVTVTPITIPTPTPTPTPSAGNTYVIVSGDTLAKIATKKYGSATAAGVNSIRVQNRGRLPWINTFSQTASLNSYIGTTLSIPAIHASAPTPTATPAPKPAPPKTAPPAVRRYTVKSGDTLSSIAQHYYGSPNWQKISDANKGVVGSDPSLIRPGEVLVIPA